MNEYVFDVKLFTAVRVKAGSEVEARRMLRDALECADGNLGAWPDGSPILCELSMDGEPDLFEEDGDVE